MIAGLANKRSGAVLLGLLAIAVFVLVNLGASAVTGVRIDLTEDKLFTLSQGTRNVLKSLNRPVKLTLYYSHRLGEEAPPYGLHVTRVRDMIREFAAVAAGNLTFEEKDPEPFSEVEDAAVEAGMHGIPVDESGEKVYFGLVGDSGDARGVIPLFQLERDRFLEYDLIRLVARLQDPDKPRIGVWTSAPMFGDMTAQMRGLPTEPWAVIGQLQDNFDIKQIYLPEQLTDDVDILLLAHAAHLSDDDFYAIDQYLMRGGKALIFVDPFNEGAATRRFTMGAVPESSDLKKLFDTWGVEVTDEKIAGDLKLARLVNAGTEQQLIPAPYITWLQLGRENISSDDLVTADLNRINMASAGAIDIKEGAAVKAEPLLWTTQESQLVEVKNVSGQTPDIRGMVERFKSSGQRQVLAVRLTGKVKSAFPDGPPKEKKAEDKDKADKDTAAEGDGKTAKKKPDAAKPAEEGKDEPKKDEAKDEGTKEKEDDKPKWKPHVGETQVPLNVILVADTDMLSNSFWVQIRDFFGRRFQVPVANNGDFVLNAVENLAGSSDLISLRSRGSAHRPFTKLEEMQLAAQEQYKAEEQRLMRQLEETEKKLKELQGAAGPQKEGGDAAKALTPEQKVEVEKSTEQLLETRKALRQVRHNLRKDIDTLRNRLTFINVALVPILVTVAAAGLGAVRLRRRRRAVTGGGS